MTHTPTVEAIFRNSRPLLRGADCDGEPVIFDVGLRLERARWQDAIEYPDRLFVCVEGSVVLDVRDRKERGEKEGFHAMYGIGADRGKLIIMNTWGKLDLRAIDESWVRNGRCLKLTRVHIKFHKPRGPIPDQRLEEEERKRQALFYALAAPRSRAPDLSRQDDEDNLSCQDDEDKRARCEVQ